MCMGTHLGELSGVCDSCWGSWCVCVCACMGAHLRGAVGCVRLYALHDHLQPLQHKARRVNQSHKEHVVPIPRRKASIPARFHLAVTQKLWQNRELSFFTLRACAVPHWEAVGQLANPPLPLLGVLQKYLLLMRQWQKTGGGDGFFARCPLGQSTK